MKPIIKELGKVSVTPKGEWDIDKSYENIDLVYNISDGKSYISKKDVPAGIDINNTEYWMLFAESKAGGIVDLPIADATILGGVKVSTSLKEKHVPVAIDHNGSIGLNISDEFYNKDGNLTLNKDKLNTVITWDSSSDMNNIKTPGIYNIYGERTRQDDNLPILNASSGHSIAARLTVIASTLQPANNEICITQFLMLSNRLGGDGNMYVRTYNENNSPYITGWTNWQKLQSIREGYVFTDVSQVSSDNQVQIIEGVTGLNNMIDNGLYSGVYTDDGYFNGRPTFIETFTLIVINNYAIAGKLGTNRTISQLKYAVDALTNKVSIKQRTKTDGSDWSDWFNIDDISSEVDHTIIDEIKSRAIDADSLNVEREIDGVRIDFATLDDGAYSGDITIPAATTEKAGVMSAKDKVKLDSLSPGGGGGGGDYTLPIATADVLGGIKSNSTYGRVGDNPNGEEFAVNVGGDGRATATIPIADNQNYGVVKVDSSVSAGSSNPVSGKAVADAIAEAITNTLNTAV